MVAGGNDMAHALREKAAISGVGETAYTRGTPKSGLALQLEASLAAIADAGLDARDIDGVVPYFPGGGIAEDFIANLGLPDLTLSVFVPMGGATCVAAIQTAAMAVATGVCKHVLISVGRTGYSGARVSTRLQQFPQFALAAEFEAPIGMFAPAQLYAQGARRHMELYGTTARHFAEIAVVTRQHAILNGNVVMNKPLTVEEHHASRMISDPFRLFDCSLESDGGAAIIVSAADRARDLRKPLVTMMGVAEGHPESPASIAQRPDLLEFGLAKAAPRAYDMAGVGPKDIDVAEIYDCFTFTVINQLETPGLLQEGRGRAVRHGRPHRRGRRPADQHPWRPFEPGPCRRPQPRGRADAPAAPRGRQGAGQGRRGRPGHRLWRHGRRLGRDPAEGGMSTAAVTPERPLPTPTRESQPFWDGMREGRFMLQHCAALRQGAALSAAGLPALLLDGEHLQGDADRRRRPYLDGVPSSVQLLLQGSRRPTSWRWSTWMPACA